MKKFAIAGALLLPLVAGAFLVQDRATLDGGRLFGQVLDLVESRYVDSVDSALLYEKAARGLVAQLQDPYSELFSPRQLTQFNTTTAGRYGGLGMQIEEQPGKGVVISKVFPHTPAEAGGVREGDLIIAIDTVGTRGWSSARVADSLRGVPGSSVKVSFGRPGVPEPIVSTFTRAVVRVPAVPYALMFGSTGYIPLQGFNETARQEVAAAVRDLIVDRSARSLVLDLRGNGGGFLDQSLSISNIFLPQGIELASVRGRNAERQVYTARERPLAPDIPLVILTDQFTASASEIVSGALQDHDRALIVGTTTFGKGLVQTLFNLDGGYALKITTGKWYTPSGRTIQKERKLLPDGQFVEVHPDSLDGDSARAARPVHKSDAGRVIVGGGGVTPDLVVKPDTFSSAEQAFLKATAAKSQDIYVTTYDYAMELKAGITSPDFVVRPEWREELYRRLARKGVTIDRALYDGARTQIDRTLEQRLARLAFGDSTARRRSLDDDVQLRTALDLLKAGRTQKELLTLAARTTAK